MSTAQLNTPILKVYNVHSFFNDVIDASIKKYGLTPKEAAELKSTYYFVLFESRQSNDVLEYDVLKFDFEYLKKFSKHCLDVFKDNHPLDLSHQFILNEFRKKLQMIKGEHSRVFELNGFSIDFKNVEILDKILTQNDQIKQNVDFTLKKFKAEIIPIELYLVLSYEIYLTYLDNDEIFNQTANSVKMELTHQVLLKQIRTIGQKILIDDGYLPIRSAPPTQDDFEFNLFANTYDTTSSLKLLTKFFGDTIWYQQFIDYTKGNESEYFSFQKEPTFKLVSSNRQYKQVSLKTDCVTKFLADEHQNNFFKIWEDRLKKDEKDFFNEVIKPQILTKNKTIELYFELHKNHDIKKLAKAMRDTALFDYGYNGSNGFVNILPSIIEQEDRIILEVNRSLFS